MSIDYVVLDSVNEFTVNDASCYWIGKEPSANPPEGATAIKHALINALEKREVKCLSKAIISHNHALVEVMAPYLGKDGYGSGDCVLSRNELKAFAEKIGQKPAFLFSESRTHIKKASDKQPGFNPKAVDDAFARETKKEIKRLIECHPNITNDGIIGKLYKRTGLGDNYDDENIMEKDLKNRKRSTLVDWIQEVHQRPKGRPPKKRIK